MRTSQQFEMMVSFRDQRRFIQVKLTDSNSAIKQACFDIYGLNPSSGSRGFQIQFHEHEYQQFVDLETNELKFQRLLQRLASSEALPKTDTHWCLRIIETTMHNTRTQSLPTTTEDTYLFQQANGGSLCTNGVANEPIPQTITPSPSTGASGRKGRVVGKESVAGSLCEVKDTSSPVIADCDTTQTSVKCRQPDEVTADLSATDHRYQLAFSRPLAQKQRSQYLTDIVSRSPSSSTTRISGSLLKSEGPPDGDSASVNSVPRIRFEVPADEYEADWVLWVYVLTEEDTNHFHYLHASKGVFDHRVDCRHIPAVEPNPLILNPFPIPLSPNDVRGQDYELNLKICNRKSLPDLKRQPLTLFPPIASQIRNADDHAAFLSQATPHQLKFSEERYHLACVLVRDGITVKWCISNMTEAPRQRGKSSTGAQETSTQVKRKRKTSKPRKKSTTRNDGTNRDEDR